MSEHAAGRLFKIIAPVYESGMFTGAEFASECVRAGITHIVWVPDSVIGLWETDLESTAGLRLLRVCREGEAWPLAAGLLVGGCQPLVMMQTTGLFESGDALRNVLYDMGLPVFAMIGARNWLNPASQDTAKRFAGPLLEAWGLNFVSIESEADKSRFVDHYLRCRQAREPGVVLLGEA